MKKSLKELKSVKRELYNVKIPSHQNGGISKEKSSKNFTRKRIKSL